MWPFKSKPVESVEPEPSPPAPVGVIDYRPRWALVQALAGGDEDGADDDDKLLFAPESLAYSVQWRGYHNEWHCANFRVWAAALSFARELTGTSAPASADLEGGEK